MAIMHSFGLESHFAAKMFSKGLKSGKNEDEKSFNVSTPLNLYFYYHLIFSILLA